MAVNLDTKPPAERGGPFSRLVPMSSQNSLAPPPGGRVQPARFVPPLPPGVPILPERVKAAKAPWPRGASMLVVVFVLFGLVRFAWHSNAPAANVTRLGNEDDRLVLLAVTPAMMAHAPRWTRIPVTLSGGARILQIDFTVVHHQPGKPPATCVWLGVLDPKTGARVDQRMPCVPGLDYLIKQQ